MGDDGQAEFLQCFQCVGMRGELAADHRVEDGAERAGGDDARVELFQRTGGGVARVRERLLAGGALVWNLVLACRTCNRGVNGKFARVADIRYLTCLHTRNSFLIESHHPLRQTLMQQVRWMDKLVDELAKGRPMAKVLRA